MVSRHIQKFADDCKVYRSVPTAEDIDILQQGIHNLCQWSKDWQMLFNAKKCKALHIGHNNAYCDDILEDFENASPYFCTYLANHICD